MISVNPQLQSDDLYYEGLMAIQAQDFGVALRNLDDALELNPRNVRALYARAVLRGEMADDGAADDFESITRLSPACGRDFFLRGMAHRYKGNLNAAIDDFSWTLQNDPMNVEALCQRAELYAALGFVGMGDEHLINALNDYNQLLELRPEEVSAYKNRGLVFIALGAHEDALADLDYYLAMQGGRIYGDELDIRYLIEDLSTGWS